MNLNSRKLVVTAVLLVVTAVILFIAAAVLTTSGVIAPLEMAFVVFVGSGMLSSGMTGLLVASCLRTGE